MEALGYKPSVTVIFLLAMIIIAHNAPVKNKRDSGVSIGDKTQQFYCTSEPTSPVYGEGIYAVN